MDIFINKKGVVIYYFFVLFLLMNLLALEVMGDQGKIASMEKLYYEKERSILMAESGLEISLNEIYEKSNIAIIYRTEAKGLIEAETEKISDFEYRIFSLGSCGSARTKIEAKVIEKENRTLMITERKIW